MIAVRLRGRPAPSRRAPRRRRRVDYCPAADGPPRVPGQAALRALRHADAARPGGADVDDAVAAAEEVGYPCVIKAQVKIGGRGKAGGIKIAHGRRRGARARAARSSGWTSAASPSTRCSIQRAADDRATSTTRRSSSIARRRSRSSCSRRAAGWTSRRSPPRRRRRSRRCTSTRSSASSPSTAGGWRTRPASPTTSCAAIAALLGQMYAAFVGEEAMLDRGQPGRHHARARGHRARREGHARRQRALPPPRERRADRPSAPSTRRRRWPPSAG